MTLKCPNISLQEDEEKIVSTDNIPQEYIVRKSSVWGYWRNKKIRNPHELTRLINKSEIRSLYPMVDHSEVYALRLKGQKGPAKESQTFILSYAYASEYFNQKESECLDKLKEAELQYYKAPCKYKDHKAYRIIVADKDVDIKLVLSLLPA